MILKVIAIIIQLCLVSASTTRLCTDGNTCRSTTTAVAAPISDILPTELSRGFICNDLAVILLIGVGGF